MITPRPSFRDCINNPNIRRAIRREFWRRCGFALGAGLTFLLFAASIVIAGKTAAAEDGHWITVEATAYCPCALCCDERTERTANGTDTNARPYAVAASPDLPFGTTLLIPVGVGYLDQTYPRESQRLFVVDDRGGALRTEWKRTGITRLDLRYKTHEYAVRFGRRMIAVKIFN